MPNPTSQVSRYGDWTERMGNVISNRILGNDGLKQMDKTAVMTLLKAANLGDIRVVIDSLLGS